MQVNAIDAEKFIKMCFATGLVPFLTGSPGIGKSNIYDQIAKAAKLIVIDLRLSQREPVDLNGFPKLYDTRAGYVPLEDFPLEGDPIPAGYNGWLLLLDEMNSAAMMTQAASYRLILDRMIGKYRLHKNVYIACAGNLATDGAIVNRVGTAMQSRLAHLELAVEFLPWSLWANTNKLAIEVTSYLNNNQGDLHVFKPDHNDKTFPAPRTWAFASRIVNHKRNISLREKLPLLAGLISQGMATQFVTYCEIFKHLTKYEDIRKDPERIHISDEPSMLAAIAGTISSNLTVADAPQVFKYINRLPLQFQVFSIRDAVQRTPELRKDKIISTWIAEHADELYA